LKSGFRIIQLAQLQHALALGRQSRKALTNEDCYRNQTGATSPNVSHRAAPFFEDRSPVVKEKAPTLSLTSASIFITIPGVTTEMKRANAQPGDLPTLGFLPAR
jgi:hypothetical protein